MDWIDRMNGALDYIEGNLAGEIDLALAARGACCSEYHLSRETPASSGGKGKLRAMSNPSGFSKW